ncbi:DUF3566 domain-containing protein [Arachnia propionica]|uniref:DUF3566 domain-containing protein n=1 Tax=Arachnia propionica TaxID=1750 RepID=UPI00163A615A|nr:DUF3566 domain-containing protein [Arachnia propionica]MDO5084721.1 DUF3566 domain-containing protein [Arachnia propionica]
MSFAPKGSRKQRNQARTQQQKQAAAPAKAEAAATTNLKQAPATTKLPAAKQDKGKQGPPQKGGPQQGQQGQQGQKPQQKPQGKPQQQQVAPQSPSSAAQQVKTEPAAAPAPAGAGAQSAASMWASSAPTAAPLAPLPAPDGSGSSSVQKPVKDGAGSKDGKSTETTKGGGRKTRKARLRLSRIDPWSVMKTAFLFSIAFGIILVVITAVLWQVIESSGALDSVNSTMNQLIGDANTKFSIQDYINSGRVVGLVTLLAAVDVVILTAVATLFAFLYNLAATVLGGLEITLAED